MSFKSLKATFFVFPNEHAGPFFLKCWDLTYLPGYRTKPGCCIPLGTMPGAAASLHIGCVGGGEEGWKKGDYVAIFAMTLF